MRPVRTLVVGMHPDVELSDADADDMERRIAAAVGCDVLLISGATSLAVVAGQVGETLEERPDVSAGQTP
jgi:hypothetical protein